MEYLLEINLYTLYIQILSIKSIAEEIFYNMQFSGLFMTFNSFRKKARKVADLWLACLPLIDGLPTTLSTFILRYYVYLMMDECLR